jgi:hypothetical protein
MTAFPVTAKDKASFPFTCTLIPMPEYQSINAYGYEVRSVDLEINEKIVRFSLSFSLSLSLSLSWYPLKTRLGEP